MAKWGEVADDHYVALSWSGGLGVDNDGYPLEPPSSDPSLSGGLDAWISQRTRGYPYRCKFCQECITFADRKPFSLPDGSPHRCLANRTRGEQGNERG